MRILFQGDSITDCLRSSYDSGTFVGSGYSCLIQADLCLNRTDVEVLNCGISGNCVTNLLARWKKDCINLHPDVISILIGVNDVWHELSQQEGVDAESCVEAKRVIIPKKKRNQRENNLKKHRAYMKH